MNKEMIAEMVFSSSSSYCLEKRLEKKIVSFFKGITNSGHRISSYSLTEDEDLMSDLYKYAISEQKNVSKNDLKSFVKLGEELVLAIDEGQGKKVVQLRGLSYEEALVSIIWYLTAKNGKKTFLNQDTWERERAFSSFSDKGEDFTYFFNKLSSIM